jgi:hypothetical protein
MFKTYFKTTVKRHTVCHIQEYNIKKRSTNMDINMYDNKKISKYRRFAIYIHKMFD